MGEKKKTYYMMNISDTAALHDVLQPEQVAAVLYNVSLFAEKEATGTDVPDMLPMDPAQTMAYKMITQRIKTQFEKGSCGAPKGNKNAEKSNKKDRVNAVKKAVRSNPGASYGQIAEMTGIPRSTVYDIIKTHGINNIDNTSRDSMLSDMLYS